MSIKSSKNSVLGAINSIKEGQDGNYKPLLTRFKHLNDKLHGGIPRQKIITIGALSSFGKSHNLRQIEEDIFDEDLNPESKENVILVKCDFEMSKEEHIIAKVHEKTGREIKEILYEKPDEVVKQAFNEVYTELSSDYIYETFNTYKPDDFYNEIINFIQPFLNPFTDEVIRQTEEKKDKDGKVIEISKPIYKKNPQYKKQIVLTVDNVNLIDTEGSDEGKAIARLITHLIRLKRDVKSLSIILLAQLNRNLRDRVNPKEHFPITSDFYFSSKLEFASDIQIIIHIPYFISIQEYGAVNHERFEYLEEYLIEKNKYSVFKTKGLVFWHYVKVRVKGSMRDFKDVFVEKMFEVDENDTESKTKATASSGMPDFTKGLPTPTLDEAFGSDGTDDNDAPF